MDAKPTARKSALQRFAWLAGQWAGTNKLWLDPEDPARVSESIMIVGTKGKGRFVTFTYTWANLEEPQDGLIVFAFDDDRNVITAHWLDSFHTGDKVMPFEGGAEQGGAVLVRGSYAVPPGPEWGWTIRIEPGDDTFRIVMHNIWPNGREDLAVEATYTRT
jgi:hypothetical protein